MAEVGHELACSLGGVCQPHNLARGVYQVIVQPPAGSESAALVVDLVGYLGTIEEDMERRDFHRQRHGPAPGPSVPAQR